MARDCTDSRFLKPINQMYSPCVISGIQYKMNDQRKGEHCFECLSPEMKSYFISQTDPFHDSEYRLDGAPSSVSASSVVLTVNQEETYNASTLGLPTTPGEKFDVNIAMFPFTRGINLLSGNITTPSFFRQYTVGTGTGRYMNLLPLCLSAASSGGETFVSPGADGLGVSVTPTYGLDSSAVTAYSVQSAIYGRRLRLISESFEVVNETPEIYDSGAVTVYEVPNTAELTTAEITGMLSPSATTPANSSAVCQFFPMPPSNQKSAALLRGSSTWKARDGAYVVGRKSKGEIGFSTPGYTPIFFKGSPGVSNSTLTDSAYSAVSDQWAGNSDSETNNSNNIFPYNLSGAYFTGLSSEYTALRVRYRVSFEIIPDSSDTSLAPLASPTIPMNYDFEDFLQKTISVLPVGVKQSMNPKGEWWKKVLRSAGNLLSEGSVPLSLISPEAGMAVGSIGTGISQASNLIKSKKKPANKAAPKTRK